MKKHSLFALSILGCFPVLAQSTKMEFGTTGGLQSMSTPRSYAPVKRLTNVAGHIYLRYSVSDRWMLGIEASLANGKSTMLKEVSPTEDATYYIGAPLFGAKATITGIIHSGMWRSAITLKGGMVKTFEKEVELKDPNRFNQTEIAYPPGVGITTGLHFEESRMVSQKVGVMASVGVDYYRIYWSGNTPTSYMLDVKSAGNIIAVPVQVGVLYKF